MEECLKLISERFKRVFHKRHPNKIAHKVSVMSKTGEHFKQTGITTIHTLIELFSHSWLHAASRK